MGGLHRTVASIGFYGADLDPSEITAVLGRPTVGVKMGEKWQTALGFDEVARIGSWRLVAEDQEPGNLDYQINYLMNQLSDDLHSWRSFAERFRGRAFCGLFLNETNEGLTLKPATLARLGERGLLLDLDIYGQDLPA